MLVDPSQIEAALAPLVGLPLWSCVRAVDMQMFSFGAEVTRIARFGLRKGQQQTVGEYALHVQCAWHVAGPDGVIVASQDRYEPADESVDPADPAWDWQARGANVCDVRVDAWMVGGPYRVESIRATALGGLTIGLERGHILDVFVDSSTDWERWRFFNPESDGEHVVISGSGSRGLG